MITKVVNKNEVVMKKWLEKISKVKTFYGYGYQPYLTVYRLLKFKLFRNISVCLHYFHRPDEDPDCHDHPFHFFTLVLRGGYREEVEINGKRKINHLGFLSFGFRKASYLHRIISIKKPCWSLCIKISPKTVKLWGFVKDGKWVYWKDYIKAKGLEPIQNSEEAF